MPRRAVVWLRFEIGWAYHICPSGRRIISLRPDYQRRGARTHAEHEQDRSHNPPPLVTPSPCRRLVAFALTSTTRCSVCASHKPPSKLSRPVKQGLLRVV